MTAIGTQGTGLRHVRKTVTFTGGAGAGQLSSDITLFTTTGRVIVEYCTAWAASAWTCAAPNLTSFLIDAAGNNGGTIINVSNINGPNAGSVWVDPNESGSGLAMPAQNNGPIAVTGNVVLRFGDMGGGANVTAGSVIVDIWYRPITDNGALAGDDIDTELVAAIWANATRTLTALGFTLGASDLAADTITASKIAADAITAAKIATGAVDADALATDAVTEIVTAMLTTAMTESYNADGAAPTLAQALFLLIAALTEFSISGTTITAKKLDGSTTAATFTLNSSTTPTSRTRAT